MNRSKLFFIISAMFIISFSSVLTVNAAGPSDYTQNTTDQCTTPTDHIFITGGPGEIYNESPLIVTVGSCVTITFHNGDTSLDHTFTIDSNSFTNIALFNIYAKPGQTKSLNFQAPNNAMVIKFYCAVPGHEAAGMFGQMKVIVGNNMVGNNGPFLFFSTFLGLLVVFEFLFNLVLAYIVYRDAVKNNNHRALLISILVFFSGIIGLIVYFLVRKSNNQYTSSYTPKQSSPINQTQNMHSICANCGAELDSNSKFCQNCGAIVK